jgi:hypothetical protein
MRKSGAPAKTRDSTKSSLGAVLLVPAVVIGGAEACFSDVSLPACVVEGRPCTVEGGAPADGGAGEAGRDDVGSRDPGGGDGPSLGGQEANGLAGGPAGEVGGAEVTDPSPLVVLPAQLARPCASRAYETTLVVSGGQPPYRWALEPDRTDWEIRTDPMHSEHGTLHADVVAPGETTLSIRVDDAAGNRRQVDFTISPRNICWFAYTALEAGEPRLQLLDPFAEPASPASLDNNEGVYDFRFSPDGRYLVYCFGADAAANHGRHLALVDLASLDEQVLGFGEDTITAFSWSPDSSVLAVGFTAGGKTYLDAVSVAAPGSPEPPIVRPPVEAIVDSELYWVGNQLVAFQAEVFPDPANPGQVLDNPNHYRHSFFAQLGANGFQAPHIGTYNFFPGTVLSPTPAGFFMITAVPPGTTFIPADGVGSPVDHGTSRLLSPSGKYSATLSGEQLGVARAEDGSIFPLATADSDDACPMLLAWSPGVERLACVADVENDDGATQHGEVRFFELVLDPNADDSALTASTLEGFCDDDTSLLTPGSCGALAHGYAYGSAQASGTARAFSASGRWFALARVEVDGTFLYWADLKQKPPQLTHAAFYGAEDPRTPTRFTFSPDERLFAFQRGPQLLVQNVNRRDEFSVMSIHSPVGDACSDDFPNAPDAYCGSSEGLASVQWAPTSEAIAFRADQQLIVADLRLFPGSNHFPLPAVECGQSCSARFSFQPHFGE